MYIENPVRNQRGQGLIEYLVIVALMGVATISIVRIMGQTVASKFAGVSNALSGRQEKPPEIEVSKSAYQKRDLGNFMEGVGDKGSKH